MIFDAEIDGVSTRLEVERQGEDCRFRLGSGEKKHVRILEIEPGLYSILFGGRSYEARAENGGDCVWVTVGVRRFRVVITDPRKWTPKRAGAHGPERENIVAPMPGKIVRLLVKPGDTIEAGQGVVVVEAMKMQNEMKTRRGGRVSALPVREGETVVAGAILATIE